MIMCKKILLFFLVLCLGSLSCSKDKDQNRKLTVEDLVGTAWRVVGYEVVYDNGYKLEEYTPHYGQLTFLDAGVLRRFALGYTPTEVRYSLNNEILMLGSSTYKIIRYTGTEIELLDMENMSHKIAQESGYGFRYKRVLHKL